MAQMTKCPRCGAENSVRRVTCFACGSPLTDQAPGPAPTPDSAASRRFAAVLDERAGVARQPGERKPPPAPPPSPLPTFYGGIGQVRRAMLLFRQLHALVQAGIPLARALADLRPRVGLGLQPAVRAMEQHVVEGGKLSDAMRPYTGIFLVYQVECVRAGELAGALAEALDQLAADCEAEYKLRRAIAVALVPVFLVSVIMLLVLPVALLFREQPPGEFWTIQAIAARYASKALTVSLPIALGLGGLWILWLAAARSKTVAAVQHRLVLLIPIVGSAHKRTAMTRFLGALSLLLNAGVPISDAYRTAAFATGNMALARVLLREADSLYSGRGLVDMLRQLHLLSGITVDQMAIGEVTGKMPDVLGRLAAEYRRDAERAARYLPYLLQFAAYVVIAPLVFLVWYALLRVYLHFRFYAPLDQLFNVP